MRVCVCARARVCVCVRIFKWTIVSLHTEIWFQVLLFNINIDTYKVFISNLILMIVCTLLNSFIIAL